MTSSELLALAKLVLNARLFQLKETPVTVSSVLLFLSALVLTAIVSRVFRQTFLSRALRRLRFDQGTEYTFLRITHYTIMVIGAMIAFQFVGIDLSGLMVVLGALSVGIGFGLQNITSNFISGLIILIERPIRVGDRVTVNSIEGDVVEINIRSTIVRTLNNIDLIIPNSDFVSTQVTNWSHSDLRIRIDMDVGVSYSSDLDVVLNCLREVAAEHPDVLTDPGPEVLHLGFGDSSWNMRLRAWIPDPRRHNYIRSDINCAIVRKFRANNVEIPFPQRDLHVRTPLPLPLRMDDRS